MRKASSQKKPRLDSITNPTGRVDVALYRIASRFCERLEQEQGVKGLREHVLPLVEDAILKSVPAANMIPREIQALLTVCALNQEGAGKEAKR